MTPKEHKEFIQKVSVLHQHYRVALRASKKDESIVPYELVWGGLIGIEEVVKIAGFPVLSEELASLRKRLSGGAV